ncbi:MAG: dihydroorotate dehydrogenase (NAD+) catalytic subunit [Gammaproteobacteria bacterium]
MEHSVQNSSEAGTVQHVAGDDEKHLCIDFCGLAFATPLVLLSGCVGFGEEYTRVEGFSNRDAGAVCLKGTTLNPRLGNAAHRVVETADGMLNSIGLQNPGSRAVVDRILPTLDFSETRFIANLSGGTVDEYAQVTRVFDDSKIDAMEINISCPNVREGGVAFGNDPDMSAQVIEVCRKSTSKPIIAKLSPNQTDIAENARRCIEAGADALSVVNTFMGMSIDIEQRRPVIGANQGGLSGPAIKSMALLKVHQVYQVARAHSIPIIGQGGICTAEDAIEFLIAGASAVGIGTALFYDPLVCARINAGLVAYMRRHNIDNVQRLVGTLQPNTGAEGWAA